MMTIINLLSLIMIKNYMVPEAGLEPAHLAAGDFESPASTNSATRATQTPSNDTMCLRQCFQ